MGGGHVGCSSVRQTKISSDLPLRHSASIDVARGLAARNFRTIPTSSRTPVHSRNIRMSNSESRWSVLGRMGLASSPVATSSSSTADAEKTAEDEDEDAEDDDDDERERDRDACDRTD